MKTILVTGGAGFLGYNLCKRLLKEGNNVVCHDNMLTGQNENVDDLSSYSNFLFKAIDVKSNGYNPYNIYFDRLDEIYHMACPASPPEYQKDPVDTLLTIVNGTKNILEFAKYYNCKVLIASTSEVYGDPEVSPQSETYRGSVNPCGIRSCYDEGKRASESLAYDYKRMYGTNIRVSRTFNTAGPGMSLDDGRVVTNFIKQALTNSPLTVYGDGLQTRSICYVDDQIDGLTKLVKSDYSDTPVNIGNPEEVTMIDLAKEVIELTNSKSSIEYRPLPKDDPKKRCPDIALAKRVLGWEPKTSRRDGLIKTIAYAKQKMNS
jgi:UDP-glucuronate decarboxylase